MTRGENLQRILLNKYGVGAGRFWCRCRVKVRSPERFVKQLTEFFLAQRYIKPADRGRYRLRR